MNEIPRIGIAAVKPSFKIIVNDEPEDQLLREPMAASLPVIILGAAQPKPDAGDRLSWALGGLKRAGAQPPKFTRQHKRNLRKFVFRWCRTNLSPLQPHQLFTTEEWLEQAPYARRRKQGLLRRYRHGQTNRLTKAQINVDSFIKDEPYLSYKYPRNINSRDDYFKVMSGPFFDSVSKALMQNKFFIKYVPVPDRPSVLLEELQGFLGGEGTYFCTDYTSFEAHFTDEIMHACEFVLYRYMARDIPTLKAKVRDILTTLSGTNVCRFKHGIMSMKATRMSGEMNTSLGNGFSNLMVFLYLCKLKDCGEVRGFVEGDDGLFSVERPNNAPTVADFEACGWTIKIICTNDLNEASFCGNVFDVNERIVITDPIAALVSFGWTSKRYARSGEKVKMELLRAKAMSMAYQYNGVPLLSAFARRILQLTDTVRIRDSLLRYESYSYKQNILSAALLRMPPERTVGLSSRLLVEKLYGFSVADQIATEVAFANIQLYSQISLVGCAYPIDWMTSWDNYVHFITDSAAPALMLRGRKQCLDYGCSIYPKLRRYFVD
jgi:hypothetical protein